MTAQQFGSVDDLLAAARESIHRLSPDQARVRLAAGARLVDIRPQWQRAAEGEIPGALIVENNHLLWRLHPESGAQLPQANQDQEWIVTCQEGYTSSLAAAALVSVGVAAADLIGGVGAWAAAGLPVVNGPTEVEQIVPDQTAA